MELDAQCPWCSTRTQSRGSDGSFPCMNCGKSLLRHPAEEFLTEKALNQCPLCGCRHLYRQKDFNRKLGLALLVLGFALAYFTYGLSIVLLTLFDFWLYKRVGDVGCCYQCGTLFRESKHIDKLDLFNLSLNDYYRSLRKDPLPLKS